MNHIDRPEGMNETAAVVFDMMASISCDSDISTALIEDDLMHSWIVASLFQALSTSDLDSDIELVDVRTCNYPLDQYDQNLNLPKVNYRSTLYLRAGGWLFDSDSFLAPTTQSGYGFAAFPDDDAAVAREIARKFNPASTWYHQVARSRCAPYTVPQTTAMVMFAIKEPLAKHLAHQMRLETSHPATPQGSALRF